MVDRFETLIQGVIEQGVGVCDEFVSIDFSHLLSNHVNNLFVEGELEEAGIGKSFLHEQNTEIRSDLTKWLSRNNEDPLGIQYLDILNEFREYLNKTCYTALKNYEALYAAYPKGSYYLKHRDQFKLDMSRQYTLVLYLTQNWIDGDGGELKIWTASGSELLIEPILGRAVFFPSELEHEVLVAKKRRLSVTSWFKSII